MHAIDIEADIAAGSVSGLRDAFAALAVRRFSKPWPWERVVDSEGNALDDDTRAELLERVCLKLSGDYGVMPSELCDELGVPAGSTYAFAAAVIETTKGGSDGQR